MRLPVDDEIYNVDAVWLGPPGKTLPFRARYVAYAVGAVIFLLLHFAVAVSRLADQSKVLAQRAQHLEVATVANELVASYLEAGDLDRAGREHRGPGDSVDDGGPQRPW